MGDHWVASLLPVERHWKGVAIYELEKLLQVKTVARHNSSSSNLKPIPDMRNSFEANSRFEELLKPIPDMRNNPQIWNKKIICMRTLITDLSQQQNQSTHRRPARQILCSATYLKRWSTALCQYEILVPIEILCSF